MKYTAARNPAMDITRCVALFSVISVHFFLNTQFYNVYMVGLWMYLHTLVRCASLVCVPLFILLSGYLLKNKQPTRSYYAKLGKTVSIYFLASTCCYVYSHFLAPGASGTGSFGDLIWLTLSYQAAPYAWYINMYLGLFLMIPYLNLSYHGIPDEKGRRGLVITMILLTALPGILNTLHYSDGSWVFLPHSFQFDTVYPNFWQLSYPVTFYFLGAYLHDHPLKLKRSVNFLLILVVFLLNGTMNYCISDQDYFVMGSWQDWGALPILIQATLVFNFLAQGDYHWVKPKACALLARMSDLCLGGYLVSYIFDDFFYDYLVRIQPVHAYQLLWYPVIVPVIFLCSLALSAGINLVYSLLAKTAAALLPKKNTAV